MKNAPETISSWLRTQNLTRLDAELILAKTLEKDRIYLHAHPEQILTTEQSKSAHALATRRQGGEPLAYILGEKSFYGRDFLVTPEVLIPRPETEALVDASLKIAKTFEKTPKILDLGTGSGCIAVTLAKELGANTREKAARAEIYACDLSASALEIAAQNAKKHAAKVKFQKSDLLKGYKGQQFDLIVANLPYVDKKWPWLSDALAFEPALALYAPNYGLKLIKRLLKSAPKHLKPHAYLVLEADASQHSAILEYVIAKKLPFVEVSELHGAQKTSVQSPQSLALVLKFQPSTA